MKSFVMGPLRLTHPTWHKGTNSKVFKKTISDKDGVFEFADLDADTFIITAIKKGYKIAKQTITLEDGEEVDIEIVMKKIRRKWNAKNDFQTVIR